MVNSDLLKQAFTIRPQCAYCGCILSYNYGSNYATIDHILPKSRKGKDSISNLTLCCLKCNQKKANTVGLFYPQFTIKDLLHDC